MALYLVKGTKKIAENFEYFWIYDVHLFLINNIILDWIHIVNWMVN